MGLFSKSTSVNKLAELAIDQWNRKIKAPADEKKILLDADIQGMKHLSSLISESENDEYSKWLIEEINLATHNDLSRTMFMSSVSSSLAHAGNNTPKEFRSMSGSQAFHAVYMAGIRMLKTDPLAKLEGKTAKYEPEGLNKLQKLGHWTTTAKVISTTFNTMVDQNYTREQILDEHFYKRYKRFDPKEKFYIAEGKSHKKALKYFQNKLAYDFAQEFLTGGVYSTAQYVTGCIFIEYYPDLLFTLEDKDGKPVFPSIVEAKNSNDSERLSDQLTNLVSTYYILDKASSAVQEILSDMGLENKEILDTTAITRQLEKLHSAYRQGDLEKKGVDANLLSGIIAVLMQNGYKVELFTDPVHVNFIRVRGKDTLNIFGGKLPLRLETTVGSYDAVKCMTKSFKQSISDINDSSQYGEWTYDNIHNYDDNLEELETYSETIVNYATELTKYDSAKKFLNALVFRRAEIDKFSRELKDFTHNSSMSKLLLIHNSDTLFETLKPANDKRPNFYWYTDRFCSHQGTSKYLYIFAVDPVKDNVELRCRSGNRDFDSLHKDWLNYRDYCEGKLSEVKYSETGIAMSFSELKPIIILQARTYGSGKEDWLQTEYEIIKPHKPFSKRVISLFEAPYDELFAGKPIKFSDIPELAELIPDINDILPFKNIEPDGKGTYSIDNWLPMSSHEGGTWL